MNKVKLCDIVNNGIIEWRKHTLERMLQRNITRNEVQEALLFGKFIVMINLLKVHYFYM